MDIIERFDMADLGAMSRILRKRNLTVKMTGVTPDTITMRVTVIPEPPPKPAPLLEAANAATDEALNASEVDIASGD